MVDKAITIPPPYISAQREPITGADGRPDYIAQDAAIKYHVLADGRRTAYIEYGRTTDFSHTILFVHAGPGCRMEGGFWHRDAVELGVRIISPDRAGMGRSSPYAPGFGHGVLAAAADYLALLQSLQCDSFSILASGDAATVALAIVQLLQAAEPKRATEGQAYPLLTRVGLLAGRAPESLMWRHLPWKVTRKRLVLRYGPRSRALGQVGVAKHAAAEIERLMATPRTAKIPVNIIREGLPKAYQVAADKALLVEDRDFATQLAIHCIAVWTGCAGRQSTREAVLRVRAGWKELDLGSIRKTAESEPKTPWQQPEIILWFPQCEPKLPTIIGKKLVTWLNEQGLEVKYQEMEGQTESTMLARKRRQILEELVA